MAFRRKVPITEQNPREPINPYGATKLAFEHALEAYDRAYGYAQRPPALLQCRRSR